MDSQYADDTKPGGGTDKSGDSGDSTSWRNKPTGILRSSAAGNAGSVAVAEQPHAPAEAGGSQLRNSLAGKNLEVPVDTKLTRSQQGILAGKAADGIPGCTQEPLQQLRGGDYSSLFNTRISQTGGSEFIAIFEPMLRQQGFLILRRESSGALSDMCKL